MTAQINDTCFHEKIEYSIAGISGRGLFAPEDIGIKPAATSTACWRGYVTHYTICDSELFLTRLEIGIEKSSSDGGTFKAPELFGVSPKEDSFHGFCYEGFQARVVFTGGLLLAHDFIDELYVHMGFHPAWKYNDVREVIFDKGKIVHDYDRSAEMAELRSRISGEKRPLSEATRSEIQAWIER